MVSTICGSGKPAATSKSIVHNGFFLRLASKDPRGCLEIASLPFWSMVYKSQLTSGTVYGRQFGCRLLMSHLNSLCFISCCWVFCWGALQHPFPQVRNISPRHREMGPSLGPGDSLEAWLMNLIPAQVFSEGHLRSNLFSRQV